MKYLNLMCPFNQLGYGIASINIFKELCQIADIALFPIGKGQFPSNLNEEVEEAINKSRVFNSKDPCLKIWHEHSLAERIGSGKYIGFPFFEINELDETRIVHLSSLDTVLVASSWAKNIIDDQIGHEDVKVVPLGVDASIFRASPKKEPDEIFTFFNCGKWEKRKGHDILLEAFKRAFPNDNSVRLLMMTDNPFLKPKQISEWERYYRSDRRVVLQPRVQSSEQLSSIMQNVDCGVFPSRAEGWNLEVMEMMACGRPVIVTDYSAHTEYCTNENSYLLPVNNMEKAEDGIWFHGQGTWAIIDLDDLVDLMRHVRENWKYNSEGVETAKEFTWEKTAKGILECC